MSVAAMNRVKGDRCTVWRPAESIVNGSTEREWGDENPVANVSIRWLPVTAEIAREIFGAELRIDLSAIVPSDWNIRVKDGIGVISGEYAGRRFFVEARKPLGDYAEIGVAATSEWFPNPPDVLPPDEEATT